jgi:hypothetical protein
MTTRQLLASTATLFSLTCMAACADSDDDPAAVGSAYSLTSSPAPTESEPDTTPLA